MTGVVNLLCIPLVALWVWQSPAATPATATPQRFTVTADGHPLAVWARLPANPREAVVLVHGRTWSSRPDFDLQVPGLNRSVMQSLADRGIAAYAVDLRGYGATPRDASGFNTPNRAAADVTAVLKWVASRHPGLDPPALVGWSNGAIVAQHVAQLHPALLSSVVLFGFTPEPEMQFIPTPAPRVAPKTKNTADATVSDFLTPAVTPPAMVRAFTAQALAADPIYAEWTDEDQWNVLRADLMRVPIMILHGEHDPGADATAAGEFMAAVKSSSRRYVVIPGADHCAQLEDTHDIFISVVAEFITHPASGR